MIGLNHGPGGWLRVRPWADEGLVRPRLRWCSAGVWPVSMSQYCPQVNKRCIRPLLHASELHWCEEGLRNIKDKINCFCLTARPGPSHTVSHSWWICYEVEPGQVSGLQRCMLQTTECVWPRCFSAAWLCPGCSSQSCHSVSLSPATKLSGTLGTAPRSPAMARPAPATRSPCPSTGGTRRPPGGPPTSHPSSLASWSSLAWPCCSPAM